MYETLMINWSVSSYFTRNFTTWTCATTFYDIMIREETGIFGHNMNLWLQQWVYLVF